MTINGREMSVQDWSARPTAVRLPSAAAPMDLRLLPYEPDRDVYRLLGVPPSAGRAEIVSACRRLARAFHPDRNVSSRATEEMQVVNAVRSLLVDPRSRAEYDHSRLTFLARTAPVAVPPEAAHPLRRLMLPLGGIGLGRTARATMAAMVVAMRSLPRSRCDDCDEWVSPDYRFCPACGALLRGSVRLIASKGG
jgi:hypothetical protein